ncbi:hypothetical protein PVAR5_8642 [Paecilomyces variotii No. 5]|uniref:Yeast cell wall synthesis Kre9/Knh1-like N-terminal domain-containing protein n=1 Tax=Byssochlamys spectabilis (strain No. 5 / NBRC 109023) TaxID=1356009 RepID=V5G631_BYSSN|nr:hypothetical protein PVAR5_8642 [Paecilomyces variotii No. 5]
MKFTVATLVALAASASALQVTYPGKDAKLDLTKENKIQWNSVDTDAKTVDIYLVNNNVYPPVNTKIASNVDTSKGSYTFDLKSAKAGNGYQINLVSDEPQNTGILAQSQQFDVTEAGSSSTSAVTFTDTTTGASTSTTSGSSSTTLSTSTTGTSSASASSSASAASSSGSASSSASKTASKTGSSSTSSGSAAAATTNAASTLSVSAGVGTFLMGVAALFL